MTLPTAADQPHIDSLPRLRGLTPVPPSAIVLSVLIPVYNERETIELILDQVHAVPVRKEVICVDDCSTDGTREILQRLKDAGRINVLIHHDVQPRQGRGHPHRARRRAPATS